jgi:hypothetical protein
MQFLVHCFAVSGGGSICSAWKKMRVPPEPLLRGEVSASIVAQIRVTRFTALQLDVPVCRKAPFRFELKPTMAGSISRYKCGTS